LLDRIDEPDTAALIGRRRPVNWPRPLERWSNMKRPVFRAVPMAAFGIPVTAMILAAPFAHAQTDIEDSCKASGGQYTQSQVSAHFGQDPQLQETCCTGNKCTTWTNGVQGPTYGG